MKKGANSMQTIVVIVMIAMLGLVGYFVFFSGGQLGTTVQPSAVTQTGEVVSTAGVVSCPSDGTTDGQIRYQNTLASTVTYGNPTAYFLPLTAGLQRVTSGTLQTDGTYSTAVNLKCTEAGTRWQAIAVTSQDAYASAVGNEFVAEGSYAKVELLGKAIDTLKFKVEDKYTGGAKFFNTTVLSGGTGYVSFNGTKAVVGNDADTGTSLTLGTDGYIDARIIFKANNTKKQFGEDGLRTFMLVDADGGTWSEPIVARDSGAKLTNVLSSLSDDDRRYYSGYEYAYEIGSIDDREHYIDFYLQSAAGVNPAASSDPTVEFCAEGRYNSVKSVDSIKVGCWTDAATQAEVSTGARPYFEFDVS